MGQGRLFGEAGEEGGWRARESELGRAQRSEGVCGPVAVCNQRRGWLGARTGKALRRARCVSLRWLRAGVPLNYHTPSDFRTAHGAALDELLTEVLVVMLQQDLISLTRVSQDGLRVRASAGNTSFRRKKSLKRGVCGRQAIRWRR